MRAGSPPNSPRSVSLRSALSPTRREEKQEIVPPTAAHVLAVVALLPPRYPLPLLVLDATGMRLGEVEQLTWGDVDEPRLRWRVSQARPADGRIDGPRWVARRSTTVASGDPLNFAVQWVRTGGIHGDRLLRRYGRAVGHFRIRLDRDENTVDEEEQLVESDLATLPDPARALQPASGHDEVAATRAH